MKNSSRFDATIDRKRTRSSSGFAGSRTSSKTRHWNASSDSSRFTRRLGSSLGAASSRARAAAASAATPAIALAGAPSGPGTEGAWSGPAAAACSTETSVLAHAARAVSARR